MQIKGRPDGHLPTHTVPKQLQERSFAVVRVLHNHGAVKRKQDGVKGTVCFDGRQHIARDRLEGFLRHLAGRRCMSRDGIDQGPAIPVSGIEKGRHPSRGAAEVFWNGFSPVKAPRLEGGKIRWQIGKGIGLVLETSDQDSDTHLQLLFCLML